VCLFATGLKKAKAEGKQCHAKNYEESREVGKTLKRRTLHVPLRQNTEEKRQGKELRVL
jgi:hypothetical protein